MNRSNTEDSFRDKLNVMIQHENSHFGPVSRREARLKS